MEKYFFEIETAEAKYNVAIVPNKLQKGYNIYLGGKEYYCIQVATSLDNEFDVRNEIDCYLSPNFPNKETDSVHMINAVIFVVNIMFPEKCEITLTDMSDKNGMSVTYYMLAKSQKTWYEKYFGAYIKDKLVQNKYEETIKLFNDQKFFNDEKQMFMNIVEKSKLHIEDVAFIVEIIQNTTTFKEFFNNLAKELSTEKFAEIIKPWINDFMSSLIMKLEFTRTTKWVIPCKEMNTPIFQRYKMKQLTYDPYNGNYKSIVKKPKQIGGKYLTDANKTSFQNARWIGWKNINLDEYDSDDREYLEDLLVNF